jgi:6-phosphogluconolactonase
MSVQWHELDNLEAAAEAASHFILQRLADALSGRPYATLAVSGGSTARVLFSRLAAARFPWDRVQVFWVDERCVPPQHPESNYGLARESLLEPLRIPESHAHRIRGELRPDEAGRRYIEEIREFFGVEEGRLPSFDVLHLGLGSDAHTAGLFPGEPLLEDRAGVAAAVYIEKLNSWRVTLLPGVLLAARHTCLLTAGKAKAEAVRAVLNEPYDPLRWPAQVVTHHGRHVVCFLDHAAAGRALAAPSGSAPRA